MSASDFSDFSDDFDLDVTRNHNGGNETSGEEVAPMIVASDEGIISESFNILLIRALDGTTVPALPPALIDSRRGRKKKEYSCENCGKTVRGSSELYKHKSEYHSPSVLIGTTTFDRGTDGFFTCPGCSARFLTVSAIYKTHKFCVNGSEADVDFDADDNRNLNTVLQRFGLILSEEGDCIICPEHECILCKSCQCIYFIVNFLDSKQYARHLRRFHKVKLNSLQNEALLSYLRDKDNCSFFQCRDRPFARIPQIPVLDGFRCAYY